MIEIRKIQDGDMDIVRQNPIEEVVKNYPDMPLPDTSYAAVKDGKVVAIGGYIVFWEGMAEGWIIMTKKVYDFKFEIVRAIKEMTDLAMKHHKLRRLQISVRKDYPKAVEMAEKLGFINETPDGMKNYAPDGGDTYLFARYE